MTLTAFVETFANDLSSIATFVECIRLSDRCLKIAPTPIDIVQFTKKLDSDSLVIRIIECSTEMKARIFNNYLSLSRDVATTRLLGYTDTNAHRMLNAEKKTFRCMRLTETRRRFGALEDMRKVLLVQAVRQSIERAQVRRNLNVEPHRRLERVIATFQKRHRQVETLLQQYHAEMQTLEQSENLHEVMESSRYIHTELENLNAQRIALQTQIDDLTIAIADVLSDDKLTSIVDYNVNAIQQQYIGEIERDNVQCEEQCRLLQTDMDETLNRLMMLRLRGDTQQRFDVELARARDAATSFFASLDQRVRTLESENLKNSQIIRTSPIQRIKDAELLDFAKRHDIQYPYAISDRDIRNVSQVLINALVETVKDITPVEIATQSVLLDIFPKNITTQYFAPFIVASIIYLYVDNDIVYEAIGNALNVIQSSSSDMISHYLLDHYELATILIKYHFMLRRTEATVYQHVIHAFARINR